MDSPLNRRCRIARCLGLAALSFQAGALADPAATRSATPPGTLVESVACAGAPGQTYALYLPTGYSPGRSWPIVYVFDARGRGAFAAELFVPAAERLGYIVAASNNSRSDGADKPNLLAIKAIWEDTRARLAIDERRLYASGFSGGARVACNMGWMFSGQVAGVIGVGAGFSSELPPTIDTPFCFFGVVGTRDFNYYEMRLREDDLDHLGIPQRFVYFDGAHQWPSARVVSLGLNWMELQAMRSRLRPVDHELVDELLALALARADQLEQAGDEVQAYRAFRAAEEDFAGLADVTDAAAAASRLARSAERRLRRQRRAERRDLDYLRIFQRWVDGIDGPPELRASLPRTMDQLRIRRLRRAAAGRGSSDERLRATRLLANVLVETSYYLPRRLVESGDHAALALSLAVATEIRPDDPRLLYELACARALEGELALALAALERARTAGFSDLEMLNDDPRLQSIRGDPRFARLRLVHVE